MSETYKGYGESHMTISELQRFVKFSDPGQWCTYFTGTALPYRPGAIWEFAYELHVAGYLMLGQKRLTDGEPGTKQTCGTFAYKAYRTTKPWAEPERAAKTKAMMRA